MAGGSRLKNVERILRQRTEGAERARRAGKKGLEAMKKAGRKTGRKPGPNHPRPTGGRIRGGPGFGEGRLYPWPIMEAEYVTDETETYDSIAKKHGCGYSTVATYASTHRWRELRREHQEEVAAATRRRATTRIADLAADGVVALLEKSRRVGERLFDFLEAELPDAAGTMVPVEDTVSETVDVPASIDSSGKQVEPAKRVTRTRRLARIPPEVVRGLVEGAKIWRDTLNAILRVTSSGGDGGGGSSLLEDPMEDRARKFREFQVAARSRMLSAPTDDLEEAAMDQEGSA
uniref:Terminase n=1 Tax=viral metagenome TaxID=1070528 RepID=A0A6M3J984_9ZZZZ